MYKPNFEKLERVNKTQAAALYNAGFDVLIIPCNCNPLNPFYPFCKLGSWENKWLDGQYNSFDALCNEYAYYNCNHEIGRYIAFYVRKSAFIHFEFADGSNPYYFTGTALECMDELKKWRKHWSIEPLKQGFYKLQEV